MMVAAMQMTGIKICAHRSGRVRMRRQFLSPAAYLKGKEPLPIQTLEVLRFSHHRDFRSALWSQLNSFFWRNQESRRREFFKKMKTHRGFDAKDAYLYQCN